MSDLENPVPFVGVDEDEAIELAYASPDIPVQDWRDDYSLGEWEFAGDLAWANVSYERAVILVDCDHDLEKES